MKISDTKFYRADSAADYEKLRAQARQQCILLGVSQTDGSGKPYIALYQAPARRPRNVEDADWQAQKELGRQGAQQLINLYVKEVLGQQAGVEDQADAARDADPASPKTVYYRKKTNLVRSLQRLSKSIDAGRKNNGVVSMAIIKQIMKNVELSRSISLKKAKGVVDQDADFRPYQGAKSGAAKASVVDKALEKQGLSELRKSPSIFKRSSSIQADDIERAQMLGSIED